MQSFVKLQYLKKTISLRLGDLYCHGYYNKRLVKDWNTGGHGLIKTHSWLLVWTKKQTLSSPVLKSDVFLCSHCNYYSRYSFLSHVKVAVAQEVVWVIHYLEDWRFYHQLLCSVCQITLRQDTECHIVPDGEIHITTADFITQWADAVSRWYYWKRCVFYRLLRWGWVAAGNSLVC